MLHPVKDFGYCGPTAMALVSGLDVGECEMILTECFPRRYPWWQPIFTTYFEDLVNGLIWMGEKMGPIEHPRGTAKFVYAPTVAQFARTAEPGTYLVRVRGHFIAVDTENDQWGDSTVREPAPIKNCGWKRYRVTHACKVGGERDDKKENRQ